MDKLEEHIRKNREDLDRETPSPEVWSRINRQINKRKIPVRRLLSVAAMIIIILGTALFLTVPGLLKPGNVNNAENRLKDASENSQLKETEIYYNNLMNSLYREATPLLTGNPEIRKELSSDISHLDSICYEIKKDLKDNVDNKEVIEALIQNYRIKIRLLEDMLTMLKENETNNGEKKNHEL